MKKKKKDKSKEKALIITVSIFKEDFDLVQSAAATMEIKGKGSALRALAVQRAKQILNIKPGEVYSDENE